MMRRKPALVLTLSLLIGGLAGGPTLAVTVAESRVAASADDAEETSAGSVSIIGTDLELGWDGAPQTLGIRFPGLAVPQGATVREAWVQFETDEATSTAVVLTFQAQAADNAPSFTSATNNLTSRSREPASAPWSPAPWATVGEAGPDQRTPDLAALVQAVVDRPGWVSGNALVLFVNGPSSGVARRIARSWNIDPSGAPLLHVEYELVEVNDPPTLRIVSPLPMTQLPTDEPAPLVAEASDPEDGDLGNSVLWSSSRDGYLGLGASLSPSLSVGIHTLTAQVQDTEGLVEFAAVDVQVAAEGHVLLAAGDIASCNSTGDEATAALLDQRFGSVITLGDNAYVDGTAAQFRDCYGPSWGRHKLRTRPAAGNHDYHTSGAAGYFGYFGEAAGDPATGWYSYDIGGWHVVVLNSNCSQIGGCTRTSPQGLWLEADLAANPRDCSLAVWHHPRFSSGSAHGSSAATIDLYDIFHSHGGDLVLTGHDHNYERFAPQDAFGNADARAPRTFVVGTGGASLRSMGGIEPNSVTSAGNVYGVLALTLHESAYDWEFLPAAGYTYTDSGSASCIVAGGGPINQPPQVTIGAPADGHSIVAGAPITFTGSASDPEDGSLGATIAWSSDRDGAIGAGTSFTTSALSVGSHGIQASVQDSEGLPAIAEIDLEVTPPSTVMIEQRIAATSDDVEEQDGGTHDVSLASLDLELVEDAADQLVGLRFTTLAIPSGARIVDAWLQFQADGSTSTATSLLIQAEAVDDAPAFTRTARNVSSRARGSASVTWAPAAWTSGAQAEAQRSPSLVSVVQQVVDRAGWASGNDLVFIVTGSGQRRAEAYDGIRAGAPLLHVDYQPADQPPSGTGGCGIGPELAAAVTLLAWLHRRRRREAANCPHP
jgi:hypothetical protein